MTVTPIFITDVGSADGSDRLSTPSFTNVGFADGSDRLSPSDQSLGEAFGYPDPPV
jgi:hypothetical protein